MMNHFKTILIFLVAILTGITGYLIWITSGTTRIISIVLGFLVSAAYLIADQYIKRQTSVLTKKVNEFEIEIKDLKDKNENLNILTDELKMASGIAKRTAGFYNLVQGVKNIEELANEVSQKLGSELELCQTAFFIATKEDGKNMLTLKGSYAFHLPESRKLTFEFGEGLTGQVAKAGKMVYLDKVPDGYIEISSGLGKSAPTHLVILPLIYKGNIMGAMELSSFNPFNKFHLDFFEDLSNILGAGIQSINKLINNVIPEHSNL